MEFATKSHAPTTQMQPYIFFYGRCEEALEFYKTVFGGSCEIMRVKDAPMADQWPADSQNKVMHASFTAPGISLLASDGRETKIVDPDAGNISIALSVTDGAEGERLVHVLSQGGKVTMPLDAAFWGGRFAMFVDRFGIEWLLTTP